MRSGGLGTGYKPHPPQPKVSSRLGLRVTDDQPTVTVFTVGDVEYRIEHTLHDWLGVVYRVTDPSGVQVASGYRDTLGQALGSAKHEARMHDLFLGPQ